MCDNREQWPIQFASSADAVRFADGYLSGPKVRCGTAIMMKDRVQQSGRRPYDEKRASLEDLALTITVALSGVQKPAGDMYRYLHGKHHPLGLADHLAHQFWQGVRVEGETIARYRAIAHLALENEKRKANGRSKIKTRQIYAVLRIPKSTWYKHYQGLYLQMIELIHGLESDANKSLDYHLEKLEII